MAPVAQPIQKYNPRPFYIELFDETRPFYTSGDVIRGIVRVEPTLRPLNISVVFRGFCTIYDQSTKGGATPKFFHDKKDLFQSSGAHENFDILQRGTASDGKVELPFEFIFPYVASIAPPSDRPWKYSQDSIDHPRFQHSPGFSLPPSCPALFPGRGALAPKITYSLEAHLECVNSETPKITVRHEVKFLPPAPEYDLALIQPNVDLGASLPRHCSRYKLIRTRKLLPGYQDSSKLGKVKDMLVEKELFFGRATYSEVPFAKFNLVATPARILVIGSSIPIAVTVKHLERSSSLPSPPDLFMRRIRVQLLPTFSVFTSRPANNLYPAKENIEIARDTWTLFDKKFDEGNGEPLYDGLKLTDLGDATLAHEKLLPSFTSYGLTLEYEIQVEIWGECAKHEFSGLACRTDVQIVTGWNAAPPPVDAHGSNASLLGLDSRPAYQEVDPMADLHRSRSHGFGHDMDAAAPTYDFQNLPPTPLESTPRPMPPPYMG
jgi:hypothetical protein